MRKFSFLLFAFVLNSAFFKPVAKTPSDIFFSPDPPQKNSYYEKVVKASPETLDRSKMEYLIDRVRNSNCSFIRNGQIFPPGRAATHLAWKLQRKGKRIKTAQQFISDIASQSSMSGEAYMVKTKDGALYPVHDIMTNELNALEEHLEHQAVAA